MELPNGYNREALTEILELAKEAIEQEYGLVFLSEPVCERLLEHCRELAKNYNSQVAFEEMKREITGLVKRW